MSNRADYATRYIKPISLTDEPKARARRWGSFLEISGLSECLGINNPEFRAIINKIPINYRDHVTCLYLGKTPLVLVEPYESRTAGTLIPDDLFAIDIDASLAPYGGFVEIDPPIKPDTISYLFCNKISAFKLQKLKKILDQAAANQPDWSHIDEE